MSVVCLCVNICVCAFDFVCILQRGHCNRQRTRESWMGGKRGGVREREAGPVCLLFCNAIYSLTNATYPLPSALPPSLFPSLPLSLPPFLSPSFPPNHQTSTFLSSSPPPSLSPSSPLFFSDVLLRKLSARVLLATHEHVPNILLQVYQNKNQVDADIIRSIQQVCVTEKKRARVCVYMYVYVYHVDGCT